MVIYLTLCPHEELNLDIQLRRLVFYPLNYGDKMAQSKKLGGQVNALERNHHSVAQQHSLGQQLRFDERVREGLSLHCFAHFLAALGIRNKSFCRLFFQ